MRTWDDDYIKDNFPGLPEDNSPLDLIQLMTTQNPDALIRSEVAKEGGYNPCEEAEGAISKKKKRRRRKRNTFTMTSVSCHDPTMFTHDGFGFCYHVHSGMGMEECETVDANPLAFNNDDEITGFINLLKSGKS